MMLEVDLRPIRKDGLEGGLGVGYGDGRAWIRRNLRSCRR
jgi:hypothetical protein